MMEGCPLLSALNIFTDDGEPAGDIQRHVESCPECRETIAELKENAIFMARLRGAYMMDTSPAAGRPLSPAVGSIEPDLIADYRILNEIHRGGQGVVYRAVQVPTDRTVAIKMLLAGRNASKRDQERFEREARIAAGLRHPNIVTVYDGGYVADGRYAFAMEYIEGEPLDRWSRQLDRVQTRDSRRRALRDRLTVMAKVCEAVLYAHQHSIVHRDLKPPNILVDSGGEPHVLDFGIARDTGLEELTRLTRPGGFAGTLAYASPEQVSGDPSQVDTRTDIYSLGVIMYEVVSGRLPYPVDVPIAQAIHNIEATEPAPLHAHAPGGPYVDGEVATIILKALAKDPARRYQTAAGLANDIKRYLAGEPIDARRDSKWYVLRKTAWRHRLAVSVAAVIFILLAASAIMMRAQASRLATALSNGNVERGRGLVELGNIPEAQSLLWAELLDPPAGVQRWDPSLAQLPRSRAWWALWELHAAHPCSATVSASGLVGRAAAINLILPAPGRHDVVFIADTQSMGLWTLPGLTLNVKTTFPAGPGKIDPAWWLSGATFTPRGEIVTGATDNTVRRWDATTLAPRGQPLILPPTTQPRYLPFSADGTRLAVWHGGKILLIDPSAEALPAALESVERQPSESPRGVTLSPDGEWSAYVEREGITVLRVAAPDSQTGYPFRRPERAVHLAFTKGIGDAAPRLFFTEYSKIWMLDVQSTEGVRPFADVEGGSIVDRTALSADGRWLAVAGQDRRISIWDTATPGARALRYLIAHDAAISSLAFAEGGLALLSGHRDGVVQRWELSDLPPPPAHDGLRAPGKPAAGVVSPPRRGAFTALAGHSELIPAVAMVEGESGLRGYSGGSGDGVVRAWDLDRGREIACSAALTGALEGIALSPDSRTVAVALDLGDHSDVLLLDAATLRERSRIPNAHAIRAADIAFSPDGATLASVGDDAFVRLWDVSSSLKTAELRIPRPPGAIVQSQIRTVRFSPDGRFLAWGGLDGVTGITDAALRESPRDLSGHIATVRCVRFSPDGRRIAGAGNDSTIRIWDAATGRTLHAMRGHVGVVHGLSFSPDGHLLASSGTDGTVRVWDAATGDNLAVLRDQFTGDGEGLLVFVVEFTPDGNRLFVSGNKGYLGVWDLRHFDRHIAGNVGYWADRLKADDRASPIAGAARRWADTRRGEVEKK